MNPDRIIANDRPSTADHDAAADAPIGMIGCGRMGRGLVRNLLRHGRRVHVFDVDAAVVEAAAALGAVPAASQVQLLSVCATVITCLPNMAVIEQVYAGDDGLLANAPSATLLIETSSSHPALTRRFGEIAAQRGLAYVDAPLLGTAEQAWDGSLQVVAGGDAAALERAVPVLACIASRVLRSGPLGSAHALKALNNTVAMTNHAILSEVFAVALAAGIDRHMAFEVLRSGLGASRKLEDLAPKLIDGDHPRRAVMSTVAKDLGIFKDLADQTPIPTPVLDTTLRLYRAVCRLGGSTEPPSRLADLLAEQRGALIEQLHDSELHGSVAANGWAQETTS